MSFEGTAHHMCARGHLWTEDALAEAYLNLHDPCPFCGDGMIWTHIEDWTNGFDPNDPMNNGEIKNFKKTEDKYEPVKVVSCVDGRVIRECQELVEHETYNIPTTFGHRVEISA